MRSRFQLLPLVSVMLLSGALFAQINSVSADQAPPVPGAGHDYIHLLSETVSPAFGTVNIRIGTTVPAGRDVTVPFAFQYDSGSAHHIDFSGPIDNTSYLGRGGWNYIVPTIQLTQSWVSVGPPPPTQCFTYDNFIFGDMQGTLHPVGLEVNPAQTQACFIPGQAWPQQITSSSDGFVTATTPFGNSTNNPPPQVTVSDLEGTVFFFNTSNAHFTSGNGQNTRIYTGLPDWIESRNGDKVVITDNGNGAFQMTDTLGRAAISTSGFGATGNTVTISGLANPYTLTWANEGFSFSVTSQIIRPQILSGGATCAPSGTGTGTSSGSQPEVTQIALPNGQSYQFQYDPTYGVLSKIIYPSGAYVRYTWGLNNASTSALMVANANPNSGVPPNPSIDICEGILPTIALQHRYVSFDGINEVLQQDFAYSATTWGVTGAQQAPYEQWSAKQTTVTTHDLVTGTTQVVVYNYSAALVPELGNIPQPESGSGVHPVVPVETQVQSQDGSGHRLKTVAKLYGNPYLPPVDQLTILDTGQTSEIQNCFVTTQFHGTGSLCPNQSGPANLLTDSYEFDYGFGARGALLRHTHIDYATFPTTPLGATILNRSCRTITYDGSGNRTAETDSLYDGGSAVCGAAGTPSVSPVSGLPAGTHDETNYSAASTSPRGNATKVIRKCFLPSNGQTCTDAVTTFTYDETGQLLSTVDPVGNAANDPTHHTTSYSYADSYTEGTAPANTNAYVTQITHPTTNGVIHVEKFSYAYSDGQLTKYIDENNQSTQYLHNDVWRRLTETDYPDGGSTTYSYNGDALPLTVTKTIAASPDPNIVSSTVYDGVGHTAQVQNNSDPAGVDDTDMSYDGLGRSISVSNPHRSSASSTDGTTQTQYDALGRITQITKQDGAMTTISYAGNCSTGTDEAGKRRRSCNDALGRLVEVDEPTPGVSETIQTTAATATVTISGTLQSKPSSNHATGTVTISGTDSIVPGTSSYDFGTITVFVGSNGSVSTSYGNNGSSPSAASDLASTLCSLINSTSSTNTQVQCTGTNGGGINLTAQAAGTAGNGITLGVSAQTQFPQSNQSAFSSSSTSGSLSGGGALIYDSSSTSITVSGFGDSTFWFGSGTTPTSIATNLAAAINNDVNAVVTASASGGTVFLTAKVIGAVSNLPLSCSSGFDSSNFTGPSFTISCASSLSGGHEAGSLSAPVVTLYNYDPLGNLLQVTQQGGTTDQSQWRLRNFIYDSLSRVTQATNPESGTVQYSYDANGNMLQKTAPAPNQTGAGTVVTTVAYDALNRATQKSFSDGTTPAVTYTYDLALNWGVTQTNLVGRLSAITVNSTNTTGNQIFGYDPMGRVVVNNQCTPSNCGTANYSVTATYDLAGQLASLIYPSGRKVVYGYNAGGFLNLVQFNSWNGSLPSGGVYNYWSASNANFYPNGVPKSWTTGNSVSESTVANSRLQWQEETVSNTAIATFADHVYGYGTQNNGNVLSITDQLSSVYTQTFTYDALNRTATANESRWGLGFVYDPWGNRLQQNVTAGSAGGFQITVDGKNHIQGAPQTCTAATLYCYDAAGNLLQDNLHHQYVFDGEERIKQVDGGNATYVYAAAGNRVRKDVSGNPSTEYLYFNDNPIAERNVTTGDWSDYIFAGGKRIARALALDNGLRIFGNKCSACGNQFSLFYLQNAGGLANYVVRTGDKLNLTQYQVTGSHGGLVIAFTDGTNTNWNLRDQDTYFANDDGTQNTTHLRRFDLSAFAGKTVQAFAFNQETDTAAGAFAIIYEQAAMVSADGKVVPIYTGQSSSPVASTTTTSGITGAGSQIDINRGKAIFPSTTTTFYHTNQIRSSTLITSGNGWPLWQATYLPFGEEYNPETGDDHYKFTGKERDAESGLDNFGKRYYSSTMGRFVTPDPKTVALRHLLNPQKLNKYSYVLNNSMSFLDPDGMEEVTITYRTFIPTASVTVMGKTNGGDNRGFSSAPNASSRTSITIKIETDPHIRPGNPIISVESHAGQSTTIKNGKVVETATATKGLPTATGSRDANGTPVINIQQDTKNPLSPGPAFMTPGISANLNVMVYQDASTTQVNGTAAQFPASELNVTRADGTTTPVIQFMPPSDATPWSLMKSDRDVHEKKETPSCSSLDRICPQ